MITVALAVWLAGPPAGASETLELPPPASTIDPEHGEDATPASPGISPALPEHPEPPPPTLVPDDAGVAPPTPRVRRCLPGVDPCVRSTSARLLLGGLGTLTSMTSLGLALIASDRQRIGDPAFPLAAGGMVAMSAAVIGGLAAAVGGDGPTLEDRITPATLAVGVGVSGSAVTDERDPSSMNGSFAPTWRFPDQLGRMRLIGSVGGRLGPRVARDPRPQTVAGDGSFRPINETRTLRFDIGLDLAFALPYPLAKRHPRGMGQFELRTKPMFFFARDALLLDGEDRISQRVILTPFNLGFRWNVSPRQRFTFYMGPRWDLLGYGRAGSVVPGQPALGPIYSESWFDLDIPIRSRRAGMVGQFTLGYVHSRAFGNGLDFGPVVGFFGQLVTQFALRIRPEGSPVAYQLELGARIGTELSPYARVGIVLPDIGGRR